MQFRLDQAMPESEIWNLKSQILAQCLTSPAEDFRRTRRSRGKASAPEIAQNVRLRLSSSFGWTAALWSSLPKDLAKEWS
jgi:hypothetical protein